MGSVSIRSVYASADYPKFYLIIASVAAFAAIVSAVATAVLARLTARLARATEDYAGLVRQELDVLRAQIEPTLLFEVQYTPGFPPACYASCTHFGPTNSLPVRITRVELLLEPWPRDGTVLARYDRSFEDYLKPGRTWSKQVGMDVAAKISGLPRPGFVPALTRTGKRAQKAGYLLALLKYERGKELLEASREYEVWSGWLGGHALRPTVQ